MARGDLRFLDAQIEDGSTSESELNSDEVDEDLYGHDADERGAASVSDEEGPSAGKGAEVDVDFSSTPVTPGPHPGRKITIKLAGQDGDLTCHVCGKKGHCAGFVGAKYVDCPNKPCYLCGQSGHSTMTCPYRADPGHDCTPSQASSSIPLDLWRRERGLSVSSSAWEFPAKRWHVDAAVLRLHDKRVTCLEFHPTNDALVLSGSKGGRIAVWDMERVYERTVYRDINRWQTMGLRFLPGGDSCATCSQDGTVKLFDVETGVARTLHKANSDNWTESSGVPWICFMALDVLGDGTIASGDTRGQLFLFDPRVDHPVSTLQAHKKGGKIQSVSANPADSALLMTAGNDYAARILDLRCLQDSSGDNVISSAKAWSPLSAEITALMHPKVINAAYFSPVSGRKILTTAQDNRLRVWDYVLAADQEPERVIVHSQNFNRYLTPFRAEWDPKDPAERLIICGRYISEDFGGVALHPVDLLDAGSGKLVAELVDPNVSTISPVNKIHPRQDLVVSGSSRSLFVWRPNDDNDDHGSLSGAVDKTWFTRGFAAYEGDDDDDEADDDDGSLKKKRARQRKKRAPTVEDAGVDKKKKTERGESTRRKVTKPKDDEEETESD